MRTHVRTYDAEALVEVASRILIVEFLTQSPLPGDVSRNPMRPERHSSKDWPSLIPWAKKHGHVATVLDSNTYREYQNQQISNRPKCIIQRDVTLKASSTTFCLRKCQHPTGMVPRIVRRVPYPLSQPTISSVVQSPFSSPQ